MVKCLLNSSFWRALTFAVAYFVLFYFLFNPRFFTNDDPGGMFTVSGVFFTTEPVEFLKWTNVLIGFLLKNLYLMFPFMPWYALYLIFFLFLSFLAVSYVYFDRKRGGIGFVLYLFYVLLFGRVLLTLHFTIVAILLSSSGVLLLVHIMKKGNVFKISAGVVLALLLIILGSLVRFNACLVVLLIGVPFCFLFGKMYLFDNFWKLFVTVLVSVLIIGGAQYFNSFYYSQASGWGEFYNFNASRVEILYNSRAEFFSERKEFALEEVGWTRNDYDMFRSWFFMSSDVYSLDRLKRFASFFDYNKPFHLGEFSRRVFGIYKAEWASVFVFLLFALMFLGTWKSKLHGLGFFVWFLMVFIAIDWLYKPLTPWLYVPLNLYLVMAPVVLSGDVKYYPTVFRAKSFVVLSLLLVMGGWWISDGYIKESKLSAYNNSIFAEIVEGLSDSNIYVSWGSSLPTEWVDPFQSLVLFQNKNVIFLGSSQRTPLVQSVLEKYQIDDLYLSLLEKNVYLIVRDSLKFEMLVTYMSDHYGIDVAYDLHSKIVEGVYAYEIYKI